MLTKERAELISKFLLSDRERGKALLALDQQEAVTQINANGYDFTEEEFVQLVKSLKAVAGQNGELGVEALDDVAGGILPAIGALALFAAGVYFGHSIL